MPNVNWEDLNQLDKLISDISCIAELQMIYELEKQEPRFELKEFKHLNGAAAEFLIEKEIETIVKIKKLVDGGNFIKSQNTTSCAHCLCKPQNKK